MPLEVINTLATLTTTVVITVTAIAAVVQLSHLRASNQINTQLALRQVLLDREFWNAVGRVRDEIPPLVEDPAFQQFVIAFHRGTASDADRFEPLYEAALVVIRNLEDVGNMIRHRLADERIFLELYAPLVAVAWDSLAGVVRIRREAENSDSLWEDFEYLAALARRWTRTKRSSYPNDVERILPPVEPTVS